MGSITTPREIAIKDAQLKIRKVGFAAGIKTLQRTKWELKLKAR
jgi:hypothetical protein